jgi:hypothetical protein
MGGLIEMWFELSLIQITTEFVFSILMRGYISILSFIHIS